MSKSGETFRVRARASVKAAVLLLELGLVYFVACGTLWSYLKIRWSPHGRAIHAAQGTRVAFLSDGVGSIILPDIDVGPLEDLHLDWELLKGFCWRFSIRNEDGKAGEATVFAQDMDHLQPLTRAGEIGPYLPIDAILIVPPTLLVVWLAMVYFLDKERCRFKADLPPLPVREGSEKGPS